MRTKPLLFSLVILVLLSCNEKKDDSILHGRIHVDDYQIEFKDCAIDKSGNAYFVGYVEPDYFAERTKPPKWLKGCDEKSMVMFKLGPKGERIRLKKFPEVSQANAVIVTNNNHIVVTGEYQSPEWSYGEGGSLLGVTLSRFDSNDKQLWSKIIYRGIESKGLEVIEIDNELYVLTNSYESGESTTVLIKVSAKGEVISEIKIEHKWDVHSYQMVTKSGKIYISARVGGHGVVLQVNPETGKINKSFGWNQGGGYPSLATHLDGIVVLNKAYDFSPIILLDDGLKEIRRDSLKFDPNYGGYIQLCSDKNGATYALSAAKNNQMELIKFNNQLKQLWRKKIKNTPNFKIGGITVTKEGNLMTSGRVGNLYLNGDGYYSMFNSDGKLY